MGLKVNKVRRVGQRLNVVGKEPRTVENRSVYIELSNGKEEQEKNFRRKNLRKRDSYAVELVWSVKVVQGRRKYS